MSENVIGTISPDSNPEPTCDVCGTLIPGKRCLNCGNDGPNRGNAAMRAELTTLRAELAQARAERDGWKCEARAWRAWAKVHHRSDIAEANAWEAVTLAVAAADASAALTRHGGGK